MRPYARKTHDVSINVDSLASIWQSKYHQILQLFGWKISRLSCIADKHLQLPQSIRCSKVTAGLSPCLDETRLYKIHGKCATQYFIYLYFMRTL